MAQRQPIGVKLFYSYAREDEGLRNELQKHLSTLKNNRIIDSWHDRDITAGSEWHGAIDTHLDSADIILLLVSPDFMSSDYISAFELKQAMEKHERGDAIIIPVIVRPIDWEDAPFGKLQALPRDGNPVTTWDKGQDDAFVDIARGIKRVANEILAKRKSSPHSDVKQAVYVAETDDRDLAGYCDGIAAELEDNGYLVLPDIELPDESPDYENAVRESLQRSKLSVHLIGSRYGRSVVGANDKSASEIQNALAQERRKQGGFESIIWLPPGMLPQGTRQEAFHTYLETDPAAQINAEVSRRSFESVKDRILEKLTKQVMAPS